jgi:nicotinamide mononucleotide (NMN) deamidase PncC
MSAEKNNFEQGFFRGGLLSRRICKVASRKTISSRSCQVMIDKEKIKMLRISPDLFNDFGVLIG